MLHSRHIVVADFPDGTTETLYQGEDALRAEKSMEKACLEAKAEIVLIFHHPPIGRVRYPIQENVDAEQRATQTERLAAAAEEQRKQKAADLREQAKKLTAEAKQLEKAPDDTKKKDSDK